MSSTRTGILSTDLNRKRGSLIGFKTGNRASTGNAQIYEAFSETEPDSD